MAVPATVLALALSSVAADAASDHYFSNSLSPQRHYASFTQHTGIYYSDAISPNSHCAGIADPFYTNGGYSPLNAGAPFNSLMNCGTGTVSRSFGGGTSVNWRGVTHNPTQATNVSISDAHYSW